MRANFVLLVTLLGLLGAMMYLGPEQSLDAQFYYTHAEAVELLSSQSEQQSQNYQVLALLDLGLIGLYSALLYRLSFRWRQNLWFLPGLFDTIETSTILGVLLSSPEQVPFWLGEVTCLKWLSGLLIAVLLTLKLVPERSENG